MAFERLDCIIKECLNHGIPINGVTLPEYETSSLVYHIGGFSKSGEAKVYEDEHGNVWCATRYNRAEDIYTFKDLTMIAFEWNRDYIDRGYKWDENWLKIFVKNGLVKEKRIVKYEVV